MRSSFLALAVALALTGARPLHSQTPAAATQTARTPDFERPLQQQAETDKTWRQASEGFMQMEKITGNRVWTFLDWNLDPFNDSIRSSSTDRGARD